MIKQIIFFCIGKWKNAQERCTKTLNNAHTNFPPKKCQKKTLKNATLRCEYSLRPLSHQLTDRVRLSVFQVDPVRPPIALYGRADVSGRRISLDDSQMETDRQYVSSRPPHREQWAVSMSALHRGADTDLSYAPSERGLSQNPCWLKQLFLLS